MDDHPIQTPYNDVVFKSISMPVSVRFEFYNLNVKYCPLAMVRISELEQKKYERSK
jgi:hypothetical protein